MEQKPHLKKDEYRLILVRHDSFVQYVKSDIFGDLFIKINKDVEGADEYFHTLSDHAGVVSVNIGEEIKEHRGTLRRIKLHIALAMLTSLYHQWEKDIRKCMGSHLKSGYDYKSSIDELLDKFKQLGWNVRKESWFHAIDDCREIVNTYKHKAVELDKLDEKHSKFFEKKIVSYPYGDEYFGREVREEELLMKEDGFCEIAGAFKQFWEQFREQFPEEHR